MIPLVAALALALSDAPPDPRAAEPRCADLLPVSTPHCEKPDGTWQRCPVPLLRARLCEIKKLRYQLDNLQLDLSATTEDRDELRSGWLRSNEVLRTQRDAALEDAGHHRRVAVLGYVLGAGGVAATVAGAFIAAREDVPTGVVVGVVGLGALAFGLGLVL